MTLRITLLVLVTGLFAAIWSQDQPTPKTATVTASKKHSRVMMSKSREKKRSLVSFASQRDEQPFRCLRSTRVLPECCSSAKHTEEIPFSDMWMFGDCEMTLPEGLVPGEYRVISDRGDVRFLSLTLDELKTYHGREDQFVTREIYEVREGDTDWYFIRVQPEEVPPTAVIAERGTHVVLPAVAERGVHQIRPAVAERDDSLRIRQEASLMIVNAGGKLMNRFFKAEKPARITERAPEKDRL